MINNDKKPLIELRINPDEESFVSGIALVEFPANESSFIAFSNSGKKPTSNLEFSANDEKMELIGLAMIPNQVIDRIADDGTGYQVVFTATTIRYIAQVFAQKGLFNSTNIEHTTVPANSYIFQSYLTDKSKGINAPIGIDGDVPDGSWVVGVKVMNSNVWSAIKTGKIKGFSVEGMFELFEVKQLEQLYQKVKPSELELAFKELEELEKLYKDIIG